MNDGMLRGDLAPMSKSIVRAEREVQAAVSCVMKVAESDGTERLHDVEARLWTALLAMGRAVLVLFLARYVAKVRTAVYEYAGHRYTMDLKHPRCTDLGTRFGKVPFVRPVARRIGRSSAACDLPVDRALRLCGGFSLGTVLAITRLCAQMAFGTARETFAQSHEWSPSSRTVVRMVDAAGSDALRAHWSGQRRSVRRVS